MTSTFDDSAVASDPRMGAMNAMLQASAISETIKLINEYKLGHEKFVKKYGYKGIKQLVQSSKAMGLDFTPDYTFGEDAALFVNSVLMGIPGVMSGKRGPSWVDKLLGFDNDTLANLSSYATGEAKIASVAGDVAGLAIPFGATRLLVGKIGTKAMRSVVRQVEKGAIQRGLTEAEAKGVAKSAESLLLRVKGAQAPTSVAQARELMTGIRVPSTSSLPGLVGRVAPAGFTGPMPATAASVAARASASRAIATARAARTAEARNVNTAIEILSQRYPAESQGVLNIFKRAKAAFTGGAEALSTAPRSASARNLRAMAETLGGKAPKNVAAGLGRGSLTNEVLQKNIAILENVQKAIDTSHRIAGIKAAATVSAARGFSRGFTNYEGESDLGAVGAGAYRGVTEGIVGLGTASAGNLLGATKLSLTAGGGMTLLGTATGNKEIAVLGLSTIAGMGK